jgi:hypothetical protein
VATIGGQPAALLVHASGDSNAGDCYVLTDVAGRVRTTLVGECVYPFDADRLTNDATGFRDLRDRVAVRGRIDRATFATPGLYAMQGFLVDTRTLAVRRVDVPDDVSLVPSVPPLGVSPDERSLVRFGYGEHADTNPELVVTDVVARHTYTLPIDARRMHLQQLGQLDPAWVSRAFEWRREDGVDRLVERAHFTPMPYRGVLSVGGDGTGYYWLEPVHEGLRDAVVAFLATEMHGERLPRNEQSPTVQPMRVDGQVVEVSYGETGDAGAWVHVGLPYGAKPSGIVAEIAHRFDAALATGRYDALFGR